jgi:hypothetical protein
MAIEKPEKGSLVAFEPFRGHHEHWDFIEAFWLRAWTVLTKNLRRLSTSSFTTGSFRSTTEFSAKNDKRM